MRLALVYCGCSIGLGFFDETECTWEGEITLAYDNPDDGLGTFTCPRCHSTGLPVQDHLVSPIRVVPSY